MRALQTGDSHEQSRPHPPQGGPEELKIVDVEVGEPGPGEIRIRHKAVGLNFIDIYQRSGLYPFPMPLQLGMEASGVVEAVGDGVTHLKAGDRAAYASHPPGAYCELRVMPAKSSASCPTHLLRDRRGHDAQGPDGAVPAQDDGRRAACRRATTSSSMRPPAASA